MNLTKSRLAIELSKLQVFSSPDPALEQYPTDSQIASDILWHAFMNNKLTTVSDLGAGTGILGLGAALLNADKVYLVDKDKSALSIAKNNQSSLESRYGKLPIKYYNCDISQFSTKVDTVIMNPPFGVQTVHADKTFLEQAFNIADTIYSVHKIESKKFIQKLVEDNNFQVVEILKFSFPLKASMQHHTKKVKRLDVGCWVIQR